MTYTAIGGPEISLSDNELRSELSKALNALNDRHRVVAVPPDMSRLHSRAGRLTKMVYDHYGERLRAVLPAIGTHFPMTPDELDEMYAGVPHSLFRVHDWQQDLATLGRVPGEFVKKVSEGRLDYEVPAQLNASLIAEAETDASTGAETGAPNYDLILSIGQVVPHEVIGMANYNKNIFIGTGGRESIHKSHYLGAVHGLERIMGRIDTPVRQVLNYASDHFATHLPIVYVLTVIGMEPSGELAVRGLFIGDDADCYRRAARLSQEVNVTTLPERVDTVVVYLDPREYKSTWIGNKAVYRSRMAIADGGKLIVLAPGVHTFGENAEIDAYIRRHGYVGTNAVMERVEEGGGPNAGDTGSGLAGNLAAAAHLIHGSSEGRFSVTYCPGGLSREEVEGVNYHYGDLERMSARYLPEDGRIGLHRGADGEPYYFISNPGLGLWSSAEALGAD